MLTIAIDSSPRHPHPRGTHRCVHSYATGPKVERQRQAIHVAPVGHEIKLHRVQLYLKGNSCKTTLAHDSSILVFASERFKTIKPRQAHCNNASLLRLHAGGNRPAAPGLWSLLLAIKTRQSDRTRVEDKHTWKTMPSVRPPAARNLPDYEYLAAVLLVR